MSIEAMKQALEVLSSSMYPQPQQMNAITSLRQAIAEAEKQEPVACPKCKEWETVCDQHLRHIKKLKKQRQPLTDEQIGMAFRKAFPVGSVVFTNGAIDFARAIEAAHGVKVAA